MIRKAFKMFLYPGMEEEYEKRHNLLWPEIKEMIHAHGGHNYSCLLYTSPSPRDGATSRMPSSA